MLFTLMMNSEDEGVRSSKSNLRKVTFVNRASKVELFCSSQITINIINGTGYRASPLTCFFICICLWRSSSSPICSPYFQIICFSELVNWLHQLRWTTHGPIVILTPFIGLFDFIILLSSLYSIYCFISISSKFVIRKSQTLR